MAPHFLGIGLFILASCSFATTYAFFKACAPVISDSQILFCQNFCSWLLILPFALKKGWKPLKTDRLPMIALRTVLGLGSLYCILLALRTVDLAEVVLLNNSAPLFVPLVVMIWHKTKITYKLWIGLMIGFIGIFMILRPGFETINPALIFALLSGVIAGIMLVTVREIAHQPLFRVMFYYFLIIWLVLSPFAFVTWVFPPPIIWLYLALASISMIIAQLTITTSMRYAPSHELAPFVYTGVIFAGLIDWIVWKDVPSVIAVIGMAVVCVGCIETMLIGKKKVDSHGN